MVRGWLTSACSSVCRRLASTLYFKGSGWLVWVVIFSASVWAMALLSFVMLWCGSSSTCPDGWPRFFRGCCSGGPSKSCCGVDWA